MFGNPGNQVTTVIATAVAAVPLISGSWAGFTWTLQRRDDRRKKEFETYHKLIEDLVGEEGDKAKRMDRQIAIIFELRHFKFYLPVTKRIFVGLKKTWANENSQLLAELDIAIKAIGHTKD